MMGPSGREWELCPGLVGILCHDLKLGYFEIVCSLYVSTLPPAEDAKELSKAHKQLLGRYYHSCSTGLRMWTEFELFVWSKKQVSGRETEKQSHWSLIPTTMLINKSIVTNMQNIKKCPLSIYHQVRQMSSCATPAPAVLHRESRAHSTSTRGALHPPWRHQTRGGNPGKAQGVI